MRRALKWVGFTLGGILGIILIAAAAVYFISNARFNQVYDLALAPVSVSSDSAMIARGRHVATVRGCVECHGDNFGGKVFINEPVIGQLWASNLTTGRGGVGGSYSEADWDRAIRHGVGPDGKPLFFMPSQEYHVLGDEDLSALVSYIKSLPPVDNEMPPSSAGPLGRVLYLTGMLPLIPAELIDHEAPRQAPPAPGPTPEYGAYLATTCMGCHGHGFSGGPIPGEPTGMDPANLTPDPETGLGNWTEADFFRALREGVRPDGTTLLPTMPVQLTSQFTDTEISAIWAYLQTVPAQPHGNR
jgi:mono/diheme cytochrome c family protein